MSADDIFSELDTDGDGALSLDDLCRAAVLLGWGWPHAPLYAALHALALRAPLRREAFDLHVRQMFEDPAGPFGRVLLGTPLHAALVRGEAIGVRSKGAARDDDDRADVQRPGIESALRELAPAESADGYDALVLRCARAEITATEAAMLVIDPQRSFTRGAWMRSFGDGAQAERQVAPIRAAFEGCARLLRRARLGAEAMLTRCPFPPESYDWDDRVAELVDRTQLYFVKPGNSVLWPTTNGFREWVDLLLEQGRSTLVMGGCTLNSCLRVSSVEVQRELGPRGLQVVVDLSAAGARLESYAPSGRYGGLSSVESAVEEMIAAGVRVAARTAWS